MQMPRLGLPRVEVNPGARYVASTAVDIKTLLGSCIAACLYDPSAGVAGLNHFLLAAPRYSRSMPYTETDAGRYGIHAMELLINDMLKLGATRAGLRAKIFGGASMLSFTSFLTSRSHPATSWSTRMCSRCVFTDGFETSQIMAGA